MRATWFAMNATEINVIPIAKTVDGHGLAKVTARLCHQPLGWTGRTRYPVHLHAAEQMDLDHPSTGAPHSARTQQPIQPGSPGSMAPLSKNENHGQKHSHA